MERKVNEAKKQQHKPSTLTQNGGENKDSSFSTPSILDHLLEHVTNSVAFKSWCLCVWGHAYDGTNGQYLKEDVRTCTFYQHLEIPASQHCLNRDATLSWYGNLELQGERKSCEILPATVFTIHMEGRFCFLQAQTGKRVVESQRNITNAVDPIWFIVHILPV